VRDRITLPRSLAGMSAFTARRCDMTGGKRLKLGVLASGGGSNLQSIIDHCIDGTLGAEVVVVISNNSTAGALARARTHGIPHIHISTATEGSPDGEDRRIADELARRNVDLVVLAGYMKRVGPVVLEAFGGRIINIHPALLPRFGGEGMYGMRVHEAVIAAHETESGPTVHIVDDKYDHGRILARRKVPVLPDDTPETLQKRVLAVEHELLPETIRNMAESWGND
jgi:phosphoribosylglycinamide formyltransferase-1